MDDSVKRYRKRRRKRLEERYDGVLEWITVKNGQHVPIKDGEAVGGPMKGQDFSGARGKRKQKDAPGGRVPSKDLTAFNEKALQSIKEETGYSDKDAKRFHQALTGYFGGDYKDYTGGWKKKEEQEINDGLSRMEAYDGPVYRGMSFNHPADRFADVEVGDEISMKSVSSWSSDLNAARSFAEVDRPSMASVLISCNDNKSGVGVQHLSRFRDYEAEVLMPSTSKWKVTGKRVVSKYDMANELVEEYKGKENRSQREESMLRFIENQLKINKPALEKGRFIMLEVDEI